VVAVVQTTQVVVVLLCTGAYIHLFDALRVQVKWNGKCKDDKILLLGECGTGDHKMKWKVKEVLNPKQCEVSDVVV
jgi:hypothetical protein